MPPLACPMKNSLACYLAIFALAVARGEDVALDFEILPNSGEATLSLSTGDSDSSSISYSGNILANVSFDLETLRASQIEFTGGSIQFPDTEFNVRGNILYTGLGTFDTQLRLTNSGIKGRLSSPNGPGPVSTLNGVIDTSFHNTTIYHGFASFTVTINGISETQSIDFGSEPSTNVSEDHTRILISEFARMPEKRILKFVIETTISDSESEVIEGSTATLNTRETGFYEAVAFAEYPTELGVWLEQNGLSIADYQSLNPFGIPYNLIYALDLAADAKRLPISFDTQSDAILPYVTIQLPETGLKRQVIPYFSFDLLPGSWSPVSSRHYIDGVESLLPGETGIVRIAFDDWPFGFLRFAVAPDP